MVRSLVERRAGRRPPLYAANVACGAGRGGRGAGNHLCEGRKSRGGAVCCDPKLLPWGPIDQRPVEKRKDVLVYTSAPMKQDLEVTGPIRVMLYASTSALDTDFTAKVVDVFPNGEARNLTDGILRVRYRNGLEKA